ncbi:hypothetical protein [Dysgonomonas sp. 25]|uniref:hypothetical protein n=1 Tax=Dysgonomonas sp. 25 TaxID=2302933 RepID=UPI0013CFFBBC|nr:hypothetical protein [Dysgonomonas sp. 25]NDV68809.1 hypothetical protein [Dysgonomonas sp. 25]
MKKLLLITLLATASFSVWGQTFDVLEAMRLQEKDGSYSYFDFDNFIKQGDELFMDMSYENEEKDDWDDYSVQVKGKSILVVGLTSDKAELSVTPIISMLIKDNNLIVHRMINGDYLLVTTYLIQYLKNKKALIGKYKTHKIISTY